LTAIATCVFVAILSTLWIEIWKLLKHRSG
jgi:hypothetical protein